MKYMKFGFATPFGLLFIALLLTGCQSSIVPLQPAAIGPPWALPETSGTSAVPTTMSSAAPAIAATVPPGGASGPVSAPSDWWVNPQNSLVQTITLENYDRVWQESLTLLQNMGFHVNWQDYRLGVITTDPRIGPEILEFFRPDATDSDSLWESTINTFRRSVRLTITPGSAPQSWRISIEVLVEKRENPLGGPGPIAFTSASAFGSNALPLENGYTPGEVIQQYWMFVGHDPKLEKKIMDELFLTL
jgi:hypothetical protein